MSKILIKLFLIWIAAGLLACRPSSSELKTIIGTDDRIELVDDADLSLAIGSIVLRDQFICTAFAISAFEVVTAGHCIGDGEREDFHFENAKGRYFIVSHLSKLIEEADLMILHLSEDRNVSSFESSETQAPIFNSFIEFADLPETGEISLVSQSSTKALLVSHGYAADLSHDELGFFRYEMDTTKGASGSPILQGNRAVGIHLGHFEDHNIGIATATATQIINGFKENGPCDSEASAILQGREIEKICLERMAVHRKISPEASCYKNTPTNFYRVPCGNGDGGLPGGVGTSDGSGTSGGGGSRPNTNSGEWGGTSEGGISDGGEGSGGSSSGSTGGHVTFGGGFPGGPGGWSGGGREQPSGRGDGGHYREPSGQSTGYEENFEESIVPVLDVIRQLSSAPPEQGVPAPADQPGTAGSASHPSQHKADQAEKYLEYVEEKLQAPPYGADSHARKTLVSVARSAVNAARTSYAKGNSQDGDAFISFATTVADMALSLTPIVGWGKDLYETVSGFGLLDNHKLSPFERTMAAVGALTGGIAGTVGVLAKSAMAAGIITDAARLAGRGEGISEATKDALKIFDSAKKYGYRNADGLKDFVTKLKPSSDSKFTHVLYPRGPGASAGAVPDGYTKVSRWIGDGEVKLWHEGGGTRIPPTISESTGRVYVTTPGAARAGEGGLNRVDFFVPSEMLKPAGGGNWRQILQPAVNTPIYNVAIFLP